LAAVDRFRLCRQPVLNSWNVIAGQTAEHPEIMVPLKTSFGEPSRLILEFTHFSNCLNYS